MKRFFAVLLVVVLLFSAVLPRQTAKAEGLTIAAIASGAFAIASASGMDFSFIGYNGEGVGQWMQNKINSWLGGHTIAEKFGSEVMRLTAGKLVIPSAIARGIVDFLSDLRSEIGVSSNMEEARTLVTREVYGLPVHPYMGGNYVNESWYLPYYSKKADIPEGQPGIVRSKSGPLVYYTWYKADHTQLSAENWASSSVDYSPSVGWFLMELQTYSGTKVGMRASLGNTTFGKTLTIAEEDVTGGQISAIVPGSYTPPESLNDLQTWEGTVANAPDTNLDDLLQDIFDQSAAGTLDVIGDVVGDVDDPQATPAPTAAPGDIVGGLDVISGQLEGIDSTLTGVQEGVGEAVGQLEGINEGVGSISEALEVPTTSEAPTFKFDLTTLFPFCIPFDIYRFVTMFSASPVAPHVQIPFNIPAVNLQYTFDLDFSSFDSVASVLRSVELIAFCVGLAILTSKVIRW